MATVEEKLDFFLKEMKAVQANQLKVTSAVGDLTSWSKGADLLAMELHDDIQDLKSRMQRLEAISSAPPHSAPPREEEGRAKGHRVETSHQGADAGALDPHHTLVTGENLKPKPCFPFDIPESSHKKIHLGVVPYVVNLEHDDRQIHSYHNSPKEDSSYHHQPKDYKLPKLNFPVFTGEHPRVWRDKCEKYFTMFQVPGHHWATYATINFKGNAELWLQTYEAQHSIELA
jgi:hypothetical protein